MRISVYYVKGRTRHRLLSFPLGPTLKYQVLAIPSRRVEGPIGGSKANERLWEERTKLEKGAEARSVADHRDDLAGRDYGRVGCRAVCAHLGLDGRRCGFEADRVGYHGRAKPESRCHQVCRRGQ